MPEYPHYIGHRQRLKQRLQTDSSQLADYEILELLLGYALPRRDTKPLAKELLDSFGSLRGVLTANPASMRKVPGFGPGLESFWKLWQEYWARIGKEQILPGTRISSPAAVVEMARTRIGFSQKESFWLVLMDNKNRLLSFNQVCEGTVDQAVVFPREVFGLALEYAAAAVILIHNHPGGDPKPSAQDRDLTGRLQNISRDLGVKILDHIVVAGDRHFSFQAEGLL